MRLELRMEYLGTIWERYHKASKTSKGKILDELCQALSYNRKYAIRKLATMPQKRGCKLTQRRRRERVYDSEVLWVVERMWKAANYPWSVRLKEILRLWLPWARRRYRLRSEVEEKLLSISASTIDRALREKKGSLKRRLYGRTKPGTLLRHQIPVKCEAWDVKQAGYVEIDLVSHSGESGSGEFIYSLNLTDISSGWVETQAVMGKGEAGVRKALDLIVQRLPFALVGIDSDNGSEFINHHLWKYCDDQDIQFTRSRPYKKDDNAHVEQKNWTHVRRLVGWDRYDSPQALEAMNELYGEELRLFLNLFQPSVKRKGTWRRGARKRRLYDRPQTPLDRLLVSQELDQGKLLELKTLREQTDPFELSETVNQKLERIWELAHYRPQLVSGQKKSKSQLNELSSVERKTLEAISQVFRVNVYARTKKGGELVTVSHG